jgi:hypothetical protein
VEVLTVEGSVLWSTILTSISIAVLAVVGFVAKSKFNELDRVTVLLNQTREQIARDHITRAEYSRDLEKLMDRFDAAFLRLEKKIDDMRGVG